MTKESFKHTILLFFFAYFVYLELMMQTELINAYGVYDSPKWWMLGGIGTCITSFLLIGFQKGEIPKLPFTENDNLIRVGITGLIVFALFSYGAYYNAYALKEIFISIPVGEEHSDIVPSLELYVKRFLGGETVYKPLEFSTWTVMPTYFPLMWLPYVFSELLQIDYRWTAYALFLGVIALYNIRLIRQDLPLLEIMIKAILPFVFINSYIFYVKNVFGYAVELTPVSFYLILTLSLFHRSKAVMVIGIVLCLLSRYAFTFWLPLYLLVYWIEHGFKPVFTVSMGVLAGVLMLYVLPFLAQDFTIFTNGLKYYGKTAETQWVAQSWQQEGQRPHHLTQGLSYAIYFYDFGEGTPQDRLAENKKVHLIACGLAALFLLLGYLVFRKRGLNIKLYLLIGLKFYLVIFYGFFYVPFSYLYMLPFFLSLAIIYHIPMLKPIQE